MDYPHNSKELIGELIKDQTDEQNQQYTNINKFLLILTPIAQSLISMASLVCWAVDSLVTEVISLLLFHTLYI